MKINGRKEDWVYEKHGINWKTEKKLKDTVQPRPALRFELGITFLIHFDKQLKCWNAMINEGKPKSASVVSG